MCTQAGSSACGAYLRAPRQFMFSKRGQLQGKALTTMILERVPFGNCMTRSAIGMNIPDMQLVVVFLIANVMLGPCVFAAS